MAKFPPRGDSGWTTSGRRPGESRENAGQGLGEPAEFAVEISDEPEDSGLAHIQQGLASLRGHGRISLFRVKPTWCAGFLTTIELSPGEEIDLAGIKRDWGGGSIQFRPQVQTSGGVKWAKGGVTVVLTGLPRENGEILSPDGTRAPERVIIEPRQAPVRPVPQVDNGAALMQTMFSSMMGLLTTVIQQQQQPAGRALAAAPVAAPPAAAVAPADPLKQLRDALAINRELNDVFGGGGDDDDEPAPTTRESLLERGLMMALDRFDKDDKKPRQATQERAQPARGWRVANGGPGRKAPLSVDEAIAVLRGLPDADKMELLGNLSGEIDPALIKAWMAGNLGGGKASAG